MSQPTLDRETILHAIENWPHEDQLALAHEILERAQTESTSPSTAPKDSTWDALYGIASNDKEPPTDEEVAQWLDEHKMEKYGH